MLIFEGRTWEEYEKLRKKNKALHRSLQRMLKEMLRGDPAEGIGKPEPLRHALQGCWSRRISQCDRCIYSYDEKAIHIMAIGGHYGDK